MWKKLGKLKSLLFNLLKVTSVLIIVPPIINYAALKREHTAMSGHGLHYDVFKGQRLFLSCKGDGVPTGKTIIKLFNFYFKYSAIERKILFHNKFFFIGQYSKN